MNFQTKTLVLSIAFLLTNRIYAEDKLIQKSNLKNYVISECAYDPPPKENINERKEFFAKFKFKDGDFCVQHIFKDPAQLVFFQKEVRCVAETGNVVGDSEVERQFGIPKGMILKNSSCKFAAGGPSLIGFSNSKIKSYKVLDYAVQKNRIEIDKIVKQVSQQPWFDSVFKDVKKDQVEIKKINLDSGKVLFIVDFKGFFHPIKKNYISFPSILDDKTRVEFFRIDDGFIGHFKNAYKIDNRYFIEANFCQPETDNCFISFYSLNP